MPTPVENPIIPGFHPDPSICRVGDDFYLVTSTFEYFPGVPIFHSRDLANWKQIGHCLTRASQLPLEKAGASAGIYAPTIRHHAGRFYMITTNMSVGKHFIVHTDNPAGEWSEPVWIDGQKWSIDPSLLFDDDGTVWLTCTGSADGKWGIVGCPLDLLTGKPQADYRVLWPGTGGAWAEAPHLYKIRGMYYLMIAEGGTDYGHMVTIARSDTPLGPFESCPHNPILTHRSSEGTVQATGHADLVETSDGSWWGVFLGVRVLGYPMHHHLGRETFLCPVNWDENGWPMFGDKGKLPKEFSTPLPESPVRPKGIRDDFDNPTLGLEWNFLRNPVVGSYRLDERASFLTLQGTEVGLDAVASPTWIGRRQQHFDVRAETMTDFVPRAANEEAGLNVRMNERFRYDLAVVAGGETGRRAVLRIRLGSITAEIASKPLPPGRMILRIVADAELYRFFAGPVGKEPEEVGVADVALLSKEVAGGFTGVYFGLYATGNGTACTKPARFDYFEYEPLPPKTRG